MKAAIFPGSFDPFTLGHLDVLKSALEVFDKITIAVGYNHLKPGFLSPDSRIRLIEKSIEPLITKKCEIEVLSYTGLTAELCKRMNIRYLIRGLRTSADYENETIIAQANKKLFPDITTIFFPAIQEDSHISSTVVRDIIINGGDASVFLAGNIHIEDYLPKNKTIYETNR